MDQDPALNKFIQFSEASDLPEIQSCFSSLCQLIDIDPHIHDNFYSIFKLKLQQWKCRALWQLLDTRAAMPEYCNQAACKGKRVLIIGAGPVGLRTAIEAVLLGAEVDVVEKRTSFSRNNVLHLWPFLIDDLRALGAKKFYGKLCAGAIDHVCIRTIQSVLLKIALVLGVKIHFPVTFVDIIEPKSSNDLWHVHTEPVSPHIASTAYDAIFCADGKQHSLKQFHSKEFRAKLAIAITANFVNHNTDQEVAVDEISGVSFIYNQSFFKSLSKEYGIELENIVYYKDDTHYFVMTAKKRSLLAKGVLKKDLTDPRELLSKNNISQTALEQYSKEAAVYSTNGGLQNLQFATNHRGNHDVAIFDFTSLFASEHASMILERKGQKLLLCVAGDTLLEPFWPTGSGLARGFLGAFDAAWMLKGFSEDKPPLELIEERETLYHLLPSTTPERLHKKTTAYSINPHTRYPNLNITVPPSDVLFLYDCDTRPVKRTADTALLHTTEPKVMRFHSIGAQDGRKIQPSKRKLEKIEPPITPPEIIEAMPEEIQTTPSHSNESYLMKFARKLFGIKTPRDEMAETLKKRLEETRKKEKKSPSTSPRKSPKKKRRKSRQDNIVDKKNPLTDNKPQTSSQQLPMEKQTPQRQTNPGVSELAKLYESGNMSDEARVAKATGKERGEVTVSKVSVANVIERLERYRKEGIDMTDCEMELKEFMMDGIEEVDIGVVDAMDRFVKEKSSRIENEKEEDKGKSEEKIPLVEGVATIMRPRSNEILDEVTAGYDDAGVTGDNVEKRASGDSILTTSNTERDITISQDSETNMSTTQRETTIQQSANDDYDTSRQVETEDSPAYPRQNSTIEERKLKMGLPAKANTYTKMDAYKRNEEIKREVQSREDKKLLQKMSPPLQSPIRKGSKDDIMINLNTTATLAQAPPTPAWRKRFSESLTLILEKLRNETDLHSAKIALQIIHFIYLNIIEDPTEDTYRRIRITSSHFIERVWQYTNAQHFFISCGWMEIDDYLVLPMEQSLELPQEVLNRQIEITDMVMHSKHISNLIQKNIGMTKTEQDTYTDSIVFQGVSKANLDCSIKLAKEIKGSSTVCQGSKESTDHPWISRNEVVTMSESAAQAREWWENKAKTITRHASNYSLYFHEEELDEINYLAQFGEEMKGRVSDRVKGIEGLTTVSSPSSDSCCTTSTEDGDQDEDDGRHGENNGCHGKNNGRHGEDDGYHGEDNGCHENEWNGNDIVRTASRQARIKWQERNEGIPSTHSNITGPVKVTLPTLEVNSGSESETTLTKWQAAQRASEQLLLNRQMSEKTDNN